MRITHYPDLMAQYENPISHVCDMTGIETEYVQFGQSLLPVLAGSEQHKDAVFCEKDGHPFIV